jgi:hypothetical protein
VSGCYDAVLVFGPVGFLKSCVVLCCLMIAFSTAQFRAYLCGVLYCRCCWSLTLSKACPDPLSLCKQATVRTRPLRQQRHRTGTERTAAVHLAQQQAPHRCDHCKHIRRSCWHRYAALHTARATVFHRLWGVLMLCSVLLGDHTATHESTAAVVSLNSTGQNSATMDTC